MKTTVRNLFYIRLTRPAVSIMAESVTSEHSNSGDSCQMEMSDKYAEYIQAHMEAIKAKCKQINICVNNLLEDQNLVLLISGGNLKLNKTCSLVYRTETELHGNFSAKCTTDDRNDIREEIDKHLEQQIQDKATVWKNVRTCLTNKYGDKETSNYVDDICGLAYNRTQICKDFNNVHKTVEKLFNDQIQHMKCTCRALKNGIPSGISLPIVITAAVSGAVLLLLLLAVGIIFYKRRNAKRKRNQQTPNVIYMQAPNSENCPVYQEVFDDRYQGYKQSPSLNPPTLPLRYTTSAKPAGQNEDALGYLEPAATMSSSRPRLPVPGNSNPGYGAPPEYRETDTENGYFEPLPNPSEDGDKGYDTLDRMKSDIVKSEAPKSITSPSNPIPAKRTKIDEQRAESPYFVLENDHESRTENVST